MTKTARLFRLSTALAVAGLLLALFAPAISVSALSSSSILLQDPRPSETGDLTLSTTGFTAATPVQCMQLQLDTQADGAGTAFGTTTGAGLDTDTTIVDDTNWALDATTNGLLEITYGTGEQPVDGSLVFNNIVNDVEGSYFGIFTTYSDAGCTTEVDQVTVVFATKAGELVQLTIDPTLTFTCTGVASGSVNGATINTDSTGSSIDFGNFTTGSTGISAHDLDVTTNAPGGYTVSIRQTAGGFTNGTDEIDSWTGGTNAVPATGFPTTTEAWGYTTDDSTLNAPNVARFTDTGNEWAGFQETNEPVMFNASAAPGGESARIGHQVSVAATTPAGTYQTTIIYTVASVY